MSLETRVTDIHEWVVNALEEDLYRKHVGRFEVQHGEGGFVLGSRSGLEGQVHIGKGNSGIERYDLRLGLNQEIVPGADQHPDYVTISYIKRPTGRDVRGLFEVHIGYAPSVAADLLGQTDQWRWNILTKTEASDKPRRGQITEATLDWIYDQLVTYRDPSPEEKAQQLGKLLTYGNKLEGMFHYASLGIDPVKVEPDLAVPHEGVWEIEKVDRPYRGRRLVLTGKEPGPSEQQDRPRYMLMVCHSGVDKVFDGHEYRPGEADQENKRFIDFSPTENPHILNQALDAIARRVGHNWR